MLPSGTIGTTTTPTSLPHRLMTLTPVNNSGVTPKMSHYSGEANGLREDGPSKTAGHLCFLRKDMPCNTATWGRSRVGEGVRKKHGKSIFVVLQEGTGEGGQAGRRQLHSSVVRAVSMC